MARVRRTRPVRLCVWIGCMTPTADLYCPEHAPAVTGCRFGQPLGGRHPFGCTEPVEPGKSFCADHQATLDKFKGRASSPGDQHIAGTDITKRTPDEIAERRADAARRESAARRDPPADAATIARVVHEQGSMTTAALAELTGVASRTLGRRVAEARKAGWLVSSHRRVHPGPTPVPDDAALKEAA